MGKRKNKRKKASPISSKLRNLLADQQERQSDPFLGDYFDFDVAPPSKTILSEVELAPVLTDEQIDINEVSVQSKYSDEFTTDNALWVLEPSDINDLSLADLEKVWMNRAKLCGSLEVAAEVFAVIQASKQNNGIYKGWQFYINHPERNS